MSLHILKKLKTLHQIRVLNKRCVDERCVDERCVDERCVDERCVDERCVYDHLMSTALHSILSIADLPLTLHLVQINGKLRANTQLYFTKINTQLTHLLQITHQQDIINLEVKLASLEDQLIEIQELISNSIRSNHVDHL